MGNPSNADFSFHVHLLARYKQVDSKDGFLWLAIDGIGEIGATQTSTKTGAPKIKMMSWFMNQDQRRQWTSSRGHATL